MCTDARMPVNSELLFIVGRCGNQCKFNGQQVGDLVCQQDHNASRTTSALSVHFCWRRAVDFIYPPKPVQPLPQQCSYLLAKALAGRHHPLPSSGSARGSRKPARFPQLLFTHRTTDTIVTMNHSTSPSLPGLALFV